MITSTTTSTTTTATASLVERLAEVIRDVFGLPDLEVTRETTSLDVEGWDSLTHTVLLLRVESEFGVRLPLEQARTVGTVGDLADLLAPLVSPAPTAADLDDETRWIILHGNCQMGFLGQLLQPIVEPFGYKVANFANFQHHDEAMMRPTPAQAARCGVFIEQVLSSVRVPLPATYKTEFPSDCRQLRAPALFMKSLWPFSAKDPRAATAGEALAAKYPYGDGLVIRLLKDCTDPEVVFQRYMDTDIRKITDLDRLHEMTMAEAVAADRLADLPLAPTIEKHFRSMRLFDTVNHPSHELTLLLRDAVVPLILDGEEFPPLQPVPAPPPITQVPIHPKVIEHFRLEWTTPESTYQYFGQPLTFEQWLRAYIAYE